MDDKTMELEEYVGAGGGWDLEEAVELCRRLEPIAVRHGAHVALTGGTLYKDGRRKDVDIHFYRVRQRPSIDEAELLADLEIDLGMVHVATWGWVEKYSYQGKDVDLFFPEREDMDMDARYA